MILEVLHHAEHAEALYADDLLHGFVTYRELLVLGVVEILLFDDRPHLLDDFMSCHHLLSNERSQFRGESQRAGVAFALSSAATSTLSKVSKQYLVSKYFFF